MKKYLKSNAIALFSFLALGLASCSDDDNSIDPVPETTDETIVEFASGNENLTNLVAALQRAELVTTLEGDGPFTVLAPTDEAFEDFLDGRSLADIPVADLQQVLLNHVISGELSAAEIIADEDGYGKTLADAPAGGDDAKMSILFDTSDGVEFNGGAEVVDNGADIKKSNGTIHVVDEVITLPSVTTIIDEDDRFDTLEDLLDTDGQPDFETILATENGTAPAPFTVFAPVNEALAALSEVPEGEDLTAVLQHHVIGESNVLSSQIEDGAVSPATLQGDALTFSIAEGVVTITDGAGNTTATVSIADIQTSNGVVHAITGVLVPSAEESNTDASAK